MIFKKEVITTTSSQYMVRIKNYQVLTVMTSPTVYWFRAFGQRGLMFKRKSEGLDFCQRTGYSKYWTVGQWYVEILK